MKSVPIYEYWFFGTCIRFLQDAHPGVAVHGTGMILEVLETTVARLEELDLKVTLNTAALEKLEKLLKELKESEESAVLSVPQTTILRSQTDDLRLTLQAELLTLKAFVTSPKRLSTDSILKNPAALLAPGVYEALTEISKHDLSEAAKCILYERPTAAAFHLMRAVEDCLRTYYCHFVRRNRCRPLLWGPMVIGLSNHRKTKTHTALLKNLDNIRLSFRNPTQHPDKVYDIEEIQDLWGLAVDVINRMNKAAKE